MPLKLLQRELSRDNRRIFYAMILNEGAFGMYLALWPLYIAALGATPTQIGVVMGLMGIARLGSLLLSSLAADRFSARRVIVGSRSMAAIGMFLLAISQQWWHLIPAGIIFSVSSLGFPIISSVIASASGSSRARTRAFSLIYTVGPSFAVLITPALGGVIAVTVNLQAVYMVAAVLLAIAVVFFATLTERPVTLADGPPVTYQEVLRYRPILLLCVLELGVIFTLTLGVTLVPNYLQEVHRIETGVIGWFGSIAALGSIVIGILIRRILFLQSPIAGIALGTASVASMLLLTLVTSSVWLFALASVFRGGYFVAWTLFAAALSEVTPERLRSRVFALGEIAAGFGFSVAPFFSGWMYDHDPTLPMITSLILVGPLLLAFSRIRRAITRTIPEAALAETRI